MRKKNYRLQPYGTFTHTLRCAAIVEIVVAALRCASDSAAIAQRSAVLSQRSAAYCVNVPLRHCKAKRVDARWNYVTLRDVT